MCIIWAWPIIYARFGPIKNGRGPFSSVQISQLIVHFPYESANSVDTPRFVGPPPQNLGFSPLFRPKICKYDSYSPVRFRYAPSSLRKFVYVGNCTPSSLQNQSDNVASLLISSFICNSSGYVSRANTRTRGGHAHFVGTWMGVSIGGLISPIKS